MNLYDMEKLIKKNLSYKAHLVKIRRGKLLGNYLKENNRGYIVDIENHGLYQVVYSR